MLHHLVSSLKVVVLCFLVAGAGGAMATARLQTDAATPVAAGPSEAAGLVVTESPRSVAETLDRLEAMLEDGGLKVVARVDHAANAEAAGKELRPTQLLIFGNPMLGTELMQAAPTAGIDLPQKFLAWEAEDGTVFLAYNDPAYLAERHGIAGQDDVLQQVSDALAKLAQGATAP